MKRLGVFILNIAVSLYLFVNGILGFANVNRSEFYTMVHTIGFPWGRDFDIALVIVLSICAIIAGVLLLVSVFRNDVMAINVILFIFIALWVAFIIIVDIINPVLDKRFEPLGYLKQLSAHLMVLGALFTSTKHFGRI
jgi:uncharacterized membrane protein YphA (DoxX/SURF4 family)